MRFYASVRTPAQSYHNARDVIDYEIDMMERSAARVLDNLPDHSDFDQFILLEAFLLHFRILLEFFAEPDRRQRDNLYFQRPETCGVSPSRETLEAAKNLAASLQAKWGQKLNKFLAHPTEPRYTTSRGWPVEEMRGRCERLWHTGAGAGAANRSALLSVLETY